MHIGFQKKTCILRFLNAFECFVDWIHHLRIFFQQENATNILYYALAVKAPP